MKKIVALLMVLGVMGVILGGCSGGGDAKPADSSAPTKTDAAPAKADAAAKTDDTK